MLVDDTTLRYSSHCSNKIAKGFIMGLKYQISIFFVVILIIHTLAEKCPPNEDISPCTCDTENDDAFVTCNDLQNINDLRTAVAGLKGHQIYSLEIAQSFIGDLPGDFFKGTNIVDLSFQYSKLTSVGDKENPPFSGLENTLKSLTIVEGFWDYEKPLTEPIPLDHLKKLTFLNLENNIIPELGNNWFAKGPVSLKDLYISNGLVKKVGDKAFTHLRNLRSLHFTGNTVNLQRSAIAPNPLYLDSIDLSDNEVKEFPNDMFSNMPALRYVYLDNNGLVQLPVNVWKPLLKQLELLFVTSNPLICDERIKELVKENLHEKIIGECASPEKLIGREIESLTVDEMQN